jgi:uncharacterized protein (DUF302 family)
MEDTMKSLLMAATLAFAIGGSVSAQDAATTYDFEGDFSDATFAVESAIIDKGLVIDYVSRVGEMLARTGADVGSDVQIFDAADVFLFCSAVLSRQMMEADPLNIAHCPYGIFVADKGGKVQVGYRNYPAGDMQAVQSLLDEIVQSAISE